MEPFEPARYEDGRPMLLGGLRQHHIFAEAVRSIPEQWQQFKALHPVPGQLGTTTYGVLCGHDSTGLEYMCGSEVETFEALPSDMGRIRISAQHYAVFLHRDHISTIKHTWDRILHEWLPNANAQSAHRPDFEVYDHRFDPSTGLGDVEIWISIEPGKNA